jgi:hypothetical protein
MQNITITRQFPIIDDFVVMPDYNAGRIPLHDALAIPGISRNQLTNVTLESASRRGQAFLETEPGLTECCDNPPADQISEVVKTKVPPYPPGGDEPPYDPNNDYPSWCPTQRCPKGSLWAAWDMPFFGQTTPCSCMGGTGGSTFTTLAETSDCVYSGITNNDLRVMITWDGQLCAWIMNIECLKARVLVWETIWTGWAYPGPTGTYWQMGLQCADMAYLNHIDVSFPF